MGSKLPRPHGLAVAHGSRPKGPAQTNSASGDVSKLGPPELGPYPRLCIVANHSLMGHASAALLCYSVARALHMGRLTRRKQTLARVHFRKVSKQRARRTRRNWRSSLLLV